MCSAHTLQWDLSSKPCWFAKLAGYINAHSPARTSQMQSVRPKFIGPSMGHWPAGAHRRTWPGHLCSGLGAGWPDEHFAECPSHSLSWHPEAPSKLQCAIYNQMRGCVQSKTNKSPDKDMNTHYIWRACNFASYMCSCQSLFLCCLVRSQLPCILAGHPSNHTNGLISAVPGSSTYNCHLGKQIRNASNAK